MATPRQRSGRSRARMDRAVSTEGTQLQQDALSIAAEGLELAVTKLREKAESGDIDAIKALISLNEDELNRSRSGANDPLLQKIAEIRAAGSPMLVAEWERRKVFLGN